MRAKRGFTREPKVQRTFTCRRKERALRRILKENLEESLEIE
jgi:hypothetical protein